MSTFYLFDMNTGAKVMEVISSTAYKAREQYAHKNFMQYCPFHIQAIKAIDVIG